MTTPRLNLGRSQFTDALLWSAAAVGVGVAGFWYPFWWDSQCAEFEKRYHCDLDTRIGFFYLWTLPIIIFYAIRATVSLVRAYPGAPLFGRRGRLGLVLILASLCWAPVAFFGFGILWNSLQSSSMDLERMKGANNSIQRMRASRSGHLQVPRHLRLALTADARRSP